MTTSIVVYDSETGNVPYHIALAFRVYHLGLHGRTQRIERGASRGDLLVRENSKPP